MNIGIVAIFYNGYGKFIPDLCRSISKLTVKPTAVTLAAFGSSHGLENPEKCLDLLREVKDAKIVYFDDFKNMGTARNEAIKITDTEWIMYISADDEILPTAIEEFGKHQDADVISIAYRVRNENGSEFVCNPRLPDKEMIFDKDFYFQSTGDWLVNYSPFRKSVWEKTPYIDSDYPNAPFWIDCAIQNVRFERVEVPCVIYKKHQESHSKKMTPFNKKEAKQTIKNYKIEQRNA